jgi:hypothetical protein
MHEGIFVNGKMTGEGVMTTFDKFGDIITVLKLKDGNPVGVIDIDEPRKEEIPRQSVESQEIKGAGTGEHHVAHNA